MNGYTSGNAFDQIMTIFAIVTGINLVLYLLDSYVPKWRTLIKEIFKRRTK